MARDSRTASGSSPLWVAMGAGLAGVLFGAAAVFWGTRGLPQPLSAHAASTVPALGTDEAVADASDTQPPTLAATTPATGLVDAVAVTRDAVVNLRTPSTRGAGVIVGGSGVVITNFHVIADVLRSPRLGSLSGADDGAPERGQVRARFENGRELPAVVVVADRDEDLAILRLHSDTPGEQFAAARLGRSGGLSVGQEVFAVGNPFGLGHTVSQGIVSAKDRTDVLSNRQLPMIQLDASINLGNSGGPLFDLEGNLVGIVTATQRRAQGIAFALPIDHVRAFLRALSEGESDRAGAMGILARYHEGALGELDYRYGLTVEHVYESGPAHAAGMRPGDVIVELRGQRFDAIAKNGANAVGKHFVKTVRSLFPGETLPVTVVRDEAVEKYEVEIAGASPHGQALIDADELLGIILDESSATPVVREIRPDSPLVGAATALRGATLVRLLGEVHSVEELGDRLTHVRRIQMSNPGSYVALGFVDARGVPLRADVRVR